MKITKLYDYAIKEIAWTLVYQPYKVKYSMLNKELLITNDGYRLFLLPYDYQIFKLNDFSQGLTKFFDNIPTEEIYFTGKQTLVGKLAFVEFENSQKEIVYVAKNNLREIDLNECKFYQKSNLSLIYVSYQDKIIYCVMPVRTPKE